MKKMLYIILSVLLVFICYQTIKEYFKENEQKVGLEVEVELESDKDISLDKEELQPELQQVVKTHNLKDLIFEEDIIKEIFYVNSEKINDNHDINQAFEGFLLEGNELKDLKSFLGDYEVEITSKGVGKLSSILKKGKYFNFHIDPQDTHVFIYEDEVFVGEKFYKVVGKTIDMDWLKTFGDANSFVDFEKIEKNIGVKRNLKEILMEGTELDFESFNEKISSISKDIIISITILEMIDKEPKQLVFKPVGSDENLVLLKELFNYMENTELTLIKNDVRHPKKTENYTITVEYYFDEYIINDSVIIMRDRVLVDWSHDVYRNINGDIGWLRDFIRR